MMPLERRNEPQMLRQFSKMYPSFNINPLLRRRQQQLVEAQAFNEWISNRRLQQDGQAYTDELGRMTEAVNRRIPAAALRTGRSVPAFTAWPGMWPLVETPATPRSMAALCEMKLNLQLVKYQLSSPEAEIPLAFVDELDDEEGQENPAAPPAAVGQAPAGCWCASEAQTHTVLSYLCEIVQRASERSYLCKRGLKILIPGFPRFGTGNPRFGK